MTEFNDILKEAMAQPKPKPKNKPRPNQAEALKKLGWDPKAIEAVTKNNG